MPSWNIHIAHVERLLDAGGRIAGAVRDRNAFLFGAVVPDIYVGYMVPGVERPMPYRATHFAGPGHIPCPREREFWRTYVEPAARALEGIVAPRSAASGASAPRSVIDFMTIERERDFVGRTQHPQRYDGAPDPVAPSRELDDAADERAVTESLSTSCSGLGAPSGGQPVEHARQRVPRGARGQAEQRVPHQEASGLRRVRSYARDRERPEADAQAARDGARVPQYAIEEKMALLAVGVMHEIARGNGGVPAHGSYQLLDEEFFTDTFAETVSAATESPPIVCRYASDAIFSHMRCG